MLKIQRTTDRTAIVLTISGRLEAENVIELCQSLAAHKLTASFDDLVDAGQGGCRRPTKKRRRPFPYLYGIKKFCAVHS